MKICICWFEVGCWIRWERYQKYILLLFHLRQQTSICVVTTREITMQRGWAVKKRTGEIKTDGFYEVSISVRNNCPLGPSHEKDMYFGRLMVICGLCYCKLECLCCSMFLQDGPQKFCLQHTYLLRPKTFTFCSIVPYF